MKKFLKTLFILLLAIVFIPIVNAEDLEYDWGSYLTGLDNADYTFVRNYGYDIFTYDYLIKLDKEGNQIDKLYLDYGYDYIDFDEENNNYIFLDCYSNYVNNTYEYYATIKIINNDLELVDSYEEQVDNYFWSDYMNATDNEYVFINVDNGEMLIVAKDLSTLEKISVADLTEEEIYELWGEYSIIYNIVESSNDSNCYHRYKKNSKGYRLLQYDRMGNASGARSGLELYNEKRELVYSNKYSNYFIAALAEDGFYVIEEIDIDDRSDRELCNYDTECSSYNKLTKYDLYGNKIYEKKLQKMTSDGDNYYYDEGRKITDVKYDNGSLLLISNYIESVKSLEEEITGRNPAIIKYSPIYDIEIKTDGNGEIKVVNTSKSGEEVTYEVIPVNGYVLGVVKVTDKDGNVIEFTSNKFTMPASDVKIEVTFMPVNPETGDLTIIAFFVIFIAGLFCTITNYKKLKFLR